MERIIKFKIEDVAGISHKSVIIANDKKQYKITNI